MSTNELRILIVDDDQNFALTLCDILTVEGYSCDVVYSAHDGIVLMREKRFDCVLSDVKLPGINGVDFYQAVKEIEPDIPFILMTAYASNELIKRGLHAGAIKALQKPLNIIMLLDFFSQITNNMHAALISRENCPIFQTIQETEKFVFENFHTVDDLIQSGKKYFTITFINACPPQVRRSEEIRALADYIPKQTIVVVCNDDPNWKTIILPSEGKLLIVFQENDPVFHIRQALKKELLSIANAVI